MSVLGGHVSVVKFGDEGLEFVGSQDDGGEKIENGLEGGQGR